MEIPFFRNCHDAREVELVTAVIERGMHWANGPEISAFEAVLAELTGRRHALAFSSGTAALHALLEYIDVRDREVIVPSFTFIATANAVLMAGGTPVLADIEPETFGLDPHSVAARITSRTKVLMPVHYGGCACRIAELKEIADAHGLVLLEDAAEALGARYGDARVGSTGQAAMFSFAPNKIISTGEGGAIVTDDRELHEALKLSRSHGRAETEDYFTSTEQMDYIALGYNYRMPTLCAALGLAQLEKLDTIIAARRRLAACYDREFAGLPGVRLPVEPATTLHTYMLYSLLVERGRETRDRLQAHLKAKGVTAKVYFEPVHHTRFYREQLGYRDRLPVTEAVAGQTLSLPVFPDLTKEAQAYVVACVSEFMDKHGHH